MQLKEDRVRKRAARLVSIRVIDGWTKTVDLRLNGRFDLVSDRNEPNITRERQVAKGHEQDCIVRWPFAFST